MWVAKGGENGASSSSDRMGPLARPVHVRICDGRVRVQPMLELVVAASMFQHYRNISPRSRFAARNVAVLISASRASGPAGNQRKKVHYCAFDIAVE